MKYDHSLQPLFLSKNCRFTVTYTIFSVSGLLFILLVSVSMAVIFYTRLKAQ